jgi:hypothetical protein
MSQDDYDHNLYQSFLDHAQEIYRERYKEKLEKDLQEC